MDSHSTHWIHGEPNANEMNLMVQREMSNLKALKRLSLNTAIGSAQDPDLPSLDISDGSENLNRSDSSGSDSSKSGSGASLFRTASGTRARRPSAVSRSDSTHSGSSNNAVASNYSDSAPRFARHASLVLQPNNVHRERSAPVRSQASSDQPLDLTEESSGEGDIQNMWVPAGLHPELAPNEWHAFVEAKLSEIRKSQEAQQNSRTAKSQSRLSHIVSDPEEYVDASALLYQRRSTNDDRRKSILELSKDFVDENEQTGEKPDTNYETSVPDLKLGATSLRRSTHRMHKPHTKPEEKTPLKHSLRNHKKLESMDFTDKSSSPLHRARPRPPLSVSISAAKAVTQTAEQPPSPSAVTPSPNASVMLGYRRRMKEPLSAPATENPSLHPQSEPPSSRSSSVSESTPSPERASELAHASDKGSSTNQASADLASSGLAASASSDRTPDRYDASDLASSTYTAFAGNATGNAAAAHASPGSSSSGNASPTEHSFTGHAFGTDPAPTDHSFGKNYTFSDHTLAKDQTPPGEHAFGDHSSGDYAFGSHTPGGHAFGGLASGGHASGDYTSGDHAFGNHASSDHAFGNNSPGGHAFGGHAFGTPPASTDRASPGHSFTGPPFRTEPTSATDASDTEQASSTGHSPMLHPSALTPGLPGNQNVPFNAQPAGAQSETLAGATSAAPASSSKLAYRNKEPKRRPKSDLGQTERSHESSPMKQSISRSDVESEPVVGSPPHDKPSKESRNERRWKWLDNKPEPQKEKDPKDAKKTFANLFKKRDSKSHKEKEKAHEQQLREKQAHEQQVHEQQQKNKAHKTQPVSSRHSPQQSAASPGPPQRSSTPAPSSANSPVHSPAQSMQAAQSGRAEKTAHGSRRTMRGHARVHSRMSNDADHSDINDMQARSSSGNANSARSEEDSVIDLNAGAQPSDAPGNSNRIDIKLPYDIPAHQVSDRSFVMMYHRFPLHIERAIYRLSHMKLTNPRRPLLQQVLLSNFMYAYLNLINYGYQQQQLAAMEEQQVNRHVSGSLEESQIEQLRQIEGKNYEDSMYTRAGGAEEEDSSSSSEEEDTDVPNKRSHVSGNSKPIY